MDFNPMYGYVVAGVAAVVALVLFLNKSKTAQTTEIKDHVSDTAEATAKAVVDQVKKVVVPVSAPKPVDLRPAQGFSTPPSISDVLKVVPATQVAQKPENTEIKPAAPEPVMYYDKQNAVDSAMNAVEKADKVQDPELKEKAKEVAGHAVDHVKEMFGVKEDKKG
jgi:hypothetical protein